MAIYFFLIVFLPLALLLFWQWSMRQKARRSEGQVAPNTHIIDGDIDTPYRVYYFHATHCAPCRATTPLVNCLRMDYPNLIKVNIAENLELAQAFGVTATPSFIAVADGVINEVKLGAPGQSWLLSHLTRC